MSTKGDGVGVILDPRTNRPGDLEDNEHVEKLTSGECRKPEDQDEKGEGGPTSREGRAQGHGEPSTSYIPRARNSRRQNVPRRKRVVRHLRCVICFRIEP